MNQGPSWTFMDPQMDPQMDPEVDPARLIWGDPCPQKVLNGPYKVYIDFFLDWPLDNLDT